ncbi:MAG: hypothetical protein MZW92_12570 [Comamonadaceae bacterium]|nr:hypothetical protein [Comamonadaceae bacterium]
MTENEIQLAVDRAIRHDDYEWNKTARVTYDGHGEFAKNMHNLLYWCPKCGREFTMKGEGNVIRCTHCGNGATVNDYYELIPLDASAVDPRHAREVDRPRTAERLPRDRGGSELRPQENGSSSASCPNTRSLRTSRLRKSQARAMLSISRAGLDFEGTKHGVPCRLHMSTDQLPTWGMCTDVSFFTTYIDGKYYEFYPERESTGKWLHVTEELHRINGGKWKNFPDATTYQ